MTYKTGVKKLTLIQIAPLCVARFSNEKKKLDRAPLKAIKVTGVHIFSYKLKSPKKLSPP